MTDKSIPPQEKADDYEKRIRDKLFGAGILTYGEWVYLVGLFQTACEHKECVPAAGTPPQCKADRYALWCDSCGVHPVNCPLRTAPPHSPDGKESLPDWKQDRADTSVLPRKPLPAENSTVPADVMERFEQGLMTRNDKALILERLHK